MTSFGRLLTYTGITGVWIASFSTSCWLSLTPVSVFSEIGRLTADSAGTGLPPQLKHPSIAEAVFGESKWALSSFFYEKADTYFHAGVMHRRTEAFEDSLFQRAAREMSSDLHVHLSGQKIQEIMPWIWLTVRIDPHNIEAYRNAAFWLNEAGHPNEAHAVLQEAQWNNPFNYEILLEDGRIYINEKKPMQAKHAFDEGLAFWPRPWNSNSDVARADRLELLLYRSLLHEVDGEKEQAISRLEEILQMFPEKKEIRERIRSLKNNEPSILATKLMSDMLGQENEMRKACDRDDEHDHHKNGNHGH
jgi:tetratricopeptide (TPR) repeat protein